MAPRHVAIRTLFMIAAFFGTLHVNQFDGHHEEQNHDADKFTHEEQPRRQLRRTACPPTLSFCKQEKARKELELQELAKAEEVRKAKLKEKAELAAKVRTSVYVEGEKIVRIFIPENHLLNSVQNSHLIRVKYCRS